MNTRKKSRCFFTVFANSGNFPFIPFIIKPLITKPIVSMNNGPWRYGFLNKSVQAFRRGIRNSFHAYSPNTIAIFLSGNSNQSFFKCLTAMNPFFQATDKRFVYFHTPRQQIAAWSNHSAAQFVQPCPSGFIASQSQNSFQPQSACAVLLRHNPPYSPKPNTVQLIYSLAILIASNIRMAG